MSDLKYKTGEEPRKGDWAQLPSWACQGKIPRVTAIGETCILVWRDDGEKRMDPAECVLVRREGEKEDRDREKYEYREGEPPDFYEGWQMLVKEPTMVFRRPRQSEPAKPKFEAEAWPVDDSTADNLLAVTPYNVLVEAQVGKGVCGFKIAGFFGCQDEARKAANQYGLAGTIGGTPYHTTSMIHGNPAKFCVATRSNDAPRS